MSEHQHHQNNDHRDAHKSGDSASSHLDNADGHDPKTMPEALKDLAGGVVSQVKHVAENKVGDQKIKVAEGLGDVAHALRQATSARHEPVIDTVRPYVEKAADQMDKVSGYVQNATLRDMAKDLESFARREPALFLGGAFALGLLGGRFLKASTPSTDSLSSKSASTHAQGESGHQNASHSDHGNRANTGPQKNDTQGSDDARGAKNNDKNNNAASNAPSSNGQKGDQNQAATQGSNGNAKPDQHKGGNDRSQNDKSHEGKASANGNDKKPTQSDSKGSESHKSDKAEASVSKNDAADKTALNDPASLVKDYSHGDSAASEEKR